jgi:hypothetical protein
MRQFQYFIFGFCFVHLEVHSILPQERFVLQNSFAHMVTQVHSNFMIYDIIASFVSFKSITAFHLRDGFSKFYPFFGFFLFKSLFTNFLCPFHLVLSSCALLTQSGPGIAMSDMARVYTVPGFALNVSSNTANTLPPDAKRSTPVWWRGLLGQGQVIVRSSMQCHLSLYKWSHRIVSISFILRLFVISQFCRI